MNDDLFTTATPKSSGPSQTLTQGQHRHFRELVREATKLDRFILGKELLTVQVESKEKTDNTNKVATRLHGSSVRFIKRFSEEYEVTISVLVREAVEFSITNNLFSTWHQLPERTDEEFD